MSFKSLLVKNGLNYSIRNVNQFLKFVRQGHTLRGRAPGVARTLEQRLQEENVQDAEVIARVNIGFPKLKLPRSQQLRERVAHLKAQRGSDTIEHQARSNQLLIDLEQVQQDCNATNGPYNSRVIADHYGIFTDLFGCAFFVPRVVLNVRYQTDADTFAPVYNGNIIAPLEAQKQPEVNFDGTTDPISGKKTKGESFWSLIATNPDGHLTTNNAEYLHWFVGNIPDGNLSKGDTIAAYLPPFPPNGIGYQRFIFVLYKQNEKLDFSSLRLDTKDYANLERRTFKTLDFYSKYQDKITPAGLSFYQTSWDKSITDFYHNVLNMKEPIYEYDFAETYLADQKFFPLKQPFNLYMDRHRDIKQINKEYLERKLAKTHPFDGPEPPPRFPNAHAIRNVPSWLKTEMQKQRLRKGRILDY